MKRRMQLHPFRMTAAEGLDGELDESQRRINRQSAAIDLAAGGLVVVEEAIEHAVEFLAIERIDRPAAEVSQEAA